MISSSICPDVGTWRAWLDGESESRTSLIAHLPTCSHCQGVVDDLRQKAQLVESRVGALTLDPGPSLIDVDRARMRLADSRSCDELGSPDRRTRPSPRVPMPLRSLMTRSRVAFSGLAAAVVLLAGLAFTPGGQSAASAFLSQFRTQSVAPITVSAQSQTELMKTINALGRLGTVSLPNGATEPRGAIRGAAQQAQTVTLAEASRIVSPLLQPDPKSLPASLKAPPKVQVMPAQSIQFTFDKAKAAAYFASIGRSDFVVPDKFDGATLAVSVPSAVLLQYGNSTSKEALFLGQSGEVAVDVVRGQVGLDEMRSFLLTLPGLPSDVVTQLANLNNWSNTLPVPIPVDVVSWKQVPIAGSPGLLLDDNSGVGSAAIWHANGHLFGMAGSLKSDDLQRIANGLVSAS